ncbi:translocation and assembly module TamA precursor [Altererythrobacter sp. B11]|uniref:autotransporter assembly complex protein TamA n=1 Tax=Altererythrobacter sp. B11 TaxID=2060312 RepID=UPI000DC6E7D1|nr:BamA/TamA family outer membrane protein [Altererythrobacter sp. B11]BBC74147.1 translocation and assembly module TamA precursor [Altererythrobacter sp. B11]
MRRLAAVLAASVSLFTTPLAAQQAADQRLEDLIPDSAVADPESWAAQGVEQAEQPQGEPATPADPAPEADSPLAEEPGIDIPWPDNAQLPEVEPLAPQEDIEFATFGDMPEPPPSSGAQERISSELVLAFPEDAERFPEREAFVDRFKSLSTIVQLDDDDNDARLAAQAEEDEELLQRLLRIYGYYNGEVIRAISDGGESDEQRVAADTKPSVRFDILPGVQYRFGAVDLGGLASAGSDYPLLRETFGIESGDPLLSDRIVSQRYALDTALGENGYAFARIADPRLLVDHDREEGDLTLDVQPGGKYRIGKVTSNVPDYMSARHLQDIARFNPGDVYRRSLQLDLRQAILATGLAGRTTITPVEVAPPADGEPGTVDIAVEMTKAPLRTIAGSLGYGTGEGLKAQASWEHRNLFPPEGMLRFRGIAGTREQLLGATFRKNNFHNRDRILTVDAFASTIDYDAYEAETLSLVGTYERVSTLLFQKPFSWSMGLELVATAQRERDAQGNRGPRQTFLIAALPFSALIDTSDDLLDPTRGYRLGGKTSPELSTRGGMQRFYVRNEVDASYYRKVSERVVLAARAKLGSITGAPLAAIAPSRRLYAGGAGSVRGYGYQAIGPSNSAGDPSGGRSVAEFSLEARVRTGLLGGALGVVPFVDAGTVGDDSLPDFKEVKFGAGVGLRYYTSFGPLRVDVATPINPGPEDAPIAVYVALGQAF